MVEKVRKRIRAKCILFFSFESQVIISEIKVRILTLNSVITCGHSSLPWHGVEYYILSWKLSNRIHGFSVTSSSHIWICPMESLTPLLLLSDWSTAPGPPDAAPPPPSFTPSSGETNETIMLLLRGVRSSLVVREHNLQPQGSKFNPQHRQSLEW